jgi:hypothetical protein
MKESIQKVKIYRVFYAKLLIPSFALSILIGLMGQVAFVSDPLTSIGISYIFIAPVFQYLTYELRNKNEYYFYFNQGLSKVFLWTLTCIVSFLIGLSLMLINLWLYG